MSAPAASPNSPRRRTREEALEELVDALDRLLAYYRTSGTPPGSLLDRIGQLRAEVNR